MTEYPIDFEFDTRIVPKSVARLNAALYGSAVFRHEAQIWSDCYTDYATICRNGGPVIQGTKGASNSLLQGADYILNCADCICHYNSSPEMWNTSWDGVASRKHTVLSIFVPTLDAMEAVVHGKTQTDLLDGSERRGTWMVHQRYATDEGRLRISKYTVYFVSSMWPLPRQRLLSKAAGP